MTCWGIYAVGCSRVSPYKATLELEGQPITMEVDTGAAVSIISQKIHASLFPRAPLHVPKVKLRTYTSDPIHVVGQRTVEVKYQGYTGQHDLYVVAGNGPSLIGRDWLTHIRLDWGSIKSVARSDANLEVEKLMEKYASVFQAGPGLMKQFSACLTLKADARPRFCRPRSVPYAIKEKVGHELDRLEGAGVLRKIDYSDWAAPIVPVPKPDGSIRICGDYKVTINPQLMVDQYPLPQPSDLMARLTGGPVFCPHWSAVVNTDHHSAASDQYSALPDHHSFY